MFIKIQSITGFTHRWNRCTTFTIWICWLVHKIWDFRHDQGSGKGVLSYIGVSKKLKPNHNYIYCDKNLWIPIVKKNIKSCKRLCEYQHHLEPRKRWMSPNNVFPGSINCVHIVMHSGGPHKRNAVKTFLKKWVIGLNAILVNQCMIKEAAKMCATFC